MIWIWNWDMNGMRDTTFFVQDLTDTGTGLARAFENLGSVHGTAYDTSFTSMSLLSLSLMTNLLCAGVLPSSAKVR